MPAWAASINPVYPYRSPTLGSIPRSRTISISPCRTVSLTLSAEGAEPIIHAAEAERRYIIFSLLRKVLKRAVREGDADNAASAGNAWGLPS